MAYERPAYKAGTRIRIDFRGTVLPGERGPLGCTMVQETDQVGRAGAIHYLYLNDATARAAILAESEDAGNRPEAGSALSISLTGTITGEDYDAPEGTVNFEIRDKAGVRWYMFADLASGSVSVVPPARGLPLEPGARATVSFEATVVNSGGYPLGTSPVREDSGVTHYLYLGAIEEILSGEYLSSRPQPGDRIRVQFATVIDGSGRKGPGSTRRVKSAFQTHYLNLDSPGIQPEGPALFTAPATRGLASSYVDARIAELGKGAGYLVVRNRDGKTVFTGASEAACTEYLDTEDLLAARFTVKSASPSGGLAAELALLTAIQERTDSVLGRRTWVLYRPEYFSLDWTREQLKYAGISPDFSSWPLSIATPEAITAARRDALYTVIEIDGTTYYASL